MKICRYDNNRVGEVVNGDVIDITAIVDRLTASNLWRDPVVAALPALVTMGSDERRAGARHRLRDVILRSPVRSPGKIIAAPVNYRNHILEANSDPAIRHGHTITDIKDAGLFLKATSSLAGPADPLVIRFPERRTDYELELVVVIGTGGSNIPLSQALSHVAGYCVGLDITLRGPEDRSFRKSIDGYGILGPWLTTANEIADPDALDLKMELNGEIKQHSNTSQMIYSVAKLIDFASSFYTLEPGDVIFTGTPEGVGPIVSGDRLHACIGGLGEMTVNVA